MASDRRLYEADDVLNRVEMFVTAGFGSRIGDLARGPLSLPSPRWPRPARSERRLQHSACWLLWQHWNLSPGCAAGRLNLGARCLPLNALGQTSPPSPPPNGRIRREMSWQFTSIMSLSAMMALPSPRFRTCHCRLPRVNVLRLWAPAVPENPHCWRCSLSEIEAVAGRVETPSRYSSDPADRTVSGQPA